MRSSIRFIMLFLFLYVGAFAHNITTLKVRAGWLVDSIQGVYADGTTTPKVGGSGGDAKEYSLANIKSITVKKGTVSGASIVGQIVLVYNDDTVANIGRALGYTENEIVTYNFPNGEVFEMSASHAHIWNGLVGDVTFEDGVLNNDEVKYLIVNHGWIIDSVQGEFANGTTTPKIGGNGGGYGKYSLEGATSIEVKNAILNGSGSVVGQIAIHYADGRTEVIGANLGTSNTFTSTYDLTDNVVVGIAGTKRLYGDTAQVVETLTFRLYDQETSGSYAEEDAFQFTISGTYFPIMTHSELNYDYSIDCDSDGVFEAQNLTSEYTCRYDSASIYKISIVGEFPHFEHHKEARRESTPVSLEQWGKIKWKSFERSFSGSVLTFNATDIPDLSETVSMKGMFSNSARSMQIDMSGWDVSNVTDMSQMFFSTAMSTDISAWDVSGVTNMRRMFFLARDFNANLAGWNVENVTNMDYMFSGAASVTNNDLSNWNVDNVTTHEGFILGTAWDENHNIEPIW